MVLKMIMFYSVLNIASLKCPLHFVPFPYILSLTFSLIMNKWSYLWIVAVNIHSVNFSYITFVAAYLRSIIYVTDFKESAF